MSNKMEQSSPKGENFRILILDIEIYQISRTENKSVSSVYVYVLVFYSFVCWVVVYGGKDRKKEIRA